MKRKEHKNNMINISISKSKIDRIKASFDRMSGIRFVLFASIVCSVIAIVYCYMHRYIVIYGDAESHLNIAKRVIDNLTPGFAQLGGIWLPLPHLLMIPFIWSNFLWRTGLAGAFVSGIAYVISSVYIYKTAHLLFKDKLAAIVGALVFMLNPNVLYLQSTPMTELVLICFFVLSIYYFIRFMFGEKQMLSLIISAFFGFCAVLTRYDGWFLVVLEAGIIILYYIPWAHFWQKIRSMKTYIKTVPWQSIQGSVIVFATLAFFGIFLWLGWGWLILGDPLYFTHSEFSAASQQQAWMARGQLPGYHNLWMSFLYYFVTAMSNAGVFMFFTAIVGVVIYMGAKENKYRLYVLLLLASPFIFNVITLFLGQSVIFIPHLTPLNWDHSLFNVRYGVMTVPLVAIAFAYLFYKSKYGGKLVLLGLFVMQFALYGVGYSQVISFEDGIKGLSSQEATIPDAQYWFNDHYDYGYVLMDDFARTISITRSPVKMQNMIYIGNKPYWEESLKEPEKYARWIIMQRDDTVWKRVWEDPEIQGRLYKYFNKVYTSDKILIFRRIDQ